MVGFFLYISQEALGPGKQVEKEFCEDTVGDDCGDHVCLGKGTVCSKEDGCLVYPALSSPVMPGHSLKNPGCL